MLKSVIGMQNKRGFTLIEILVVVLIFGITLGFALLAFGDFGRQRQRLMAAEQFVNYVKFAEQQAILENSTLGLKFDAKSYQLVRLQSPGLWQSMPQKRVFQKQSLPSNTVIHLDYKAKSKGGPQIIINSSGDITVFKLQFGSKDEANIIQIVGESNGDITLDQVKLP